jgi:hypothetical protein
MLQSSLQPTCEALPAMACQRPPPLTHTHTHTHTTFLSLSLFSLSLWHMLPILPRPAQKVYVLMFSAAGAGSVRTASAEGTYPCADDMQGGAEGVYSVVVPSEGEGSPRDTILAFESRVDAERFCGGCLGGHEHRSCPLGLCA